MEGGKVYHGREERNFMVGKKGIYGREERNFMVYCREVRIFYSVSFPTLQKLFVLMEQTSISLAT